MTSGQYSFCLLLNADWLIQISEGLAVCKEHPTTSPVPFSKSSKIPRFTDRDITMAKIIWYERTSWPLPPSITWGLTWNTLTVNSPSQMLLLHTGTQGLSSLPQDVKDPKMADAKELQTNLTEYRAQLRQASLFRTLLKPYLIVSEVFFVFCQRPKQFLLFFVRLKQRWLRTQAMKNWRNWSRI